MPERAASRGALTITTVLLLAAAALLAGAAMLGWAQVAFQVPLRGIVQVRLEGSTVLAALGPLALLALAAVAGVLATGGWARAVLGVVLLAAAWPPVGAVLRIADARWRTGSAIATADLPARSVPTGAATVLLGGPALAVGGAVLMAAAGLVLLVRGHRMPRLGRRYQAPGARAAQPAPAEGRFWERMDAGEDPTMPGHPR
ncbi:MAG TPA: Trp biosynthesis-associated membrane protein [Pseudonocardiaceae bacterium]